MPRQACVPNGGICLLKHTSMFESAAYGDLQLGKQINFQDIAVDEENKKSQVELDKNTHFHYVKQ